MDRLPSSPQLCRLLLIWATAMSLLFLFRSQVHAQTGPPALPLFERQYASSLAFDFPIFHAVYDSSHSSYLAVGRFNNQMLIARLDLDGSVIWVRQHTENVYLDRNARIEMLRNGDFLVIGQKVPTVAHVLICRFAPNGDFLHNLNLTNHAPSVSEIVRHAGVVEQANGMIHVALRYRMDALGHDDLLFLRLFPDLTIDWSRHYGLAGDDNVEVILPDGQGGIFFGGNIENSQYDYDPILGRLDSTGAIVWLHRWGVPGIAGISDMVSIPGGVVATGFRQDSAGFNGFVTSVLGNGIFVFNSKRFSQPGNQSMSWLVKPRIRHASNGEYWLGYLDETSFNPHRFVIHRLDGNLDIVSSAQIQLAQSTLLNPAIGFEPTGTNPERMIIYGGIDRDSAQGAYLAVLDSNLWSCQINQSIPVQSQVTFFGPLPDTLPLLPPLNPIQFTNFREQPIAVTDPDICAPCPYSIPFRTLYCNQPGGTNTISIPVMVHDSIDPLIAIQFRVGWDPTHFSPTGNVQTGPVPTAQDPNVDINTFPLGPGEMLIQVYFNAQAAPTARFEGAGTIATLEFNVLPAFQMATTQSWFSLRDVEEGLQIGVQFPCSNDGRITYTNDTIAHGVIVSWSNQDTLRYNSLIPPAYLKTDIQGTDPTCNATAPYQINPGPDGYFSWNLAHGSHLRITRDIPGDVQSTCPTTAIGSVVSSQDAFLANQACYPGNPTLYAPYQFIAMDVNMDGLVSVNDVTLIIWRAVENICEFPQQWNSQNPTVPSLDWRFVSDNFALTHPSYQPSATYPADDGIGYSRFRIPTVPDCMEVPTQTSGGCFQADSFSVQGVLVGDADGTWMDNPALASTTRQLSPGRVIVDLDQAMADGECRLRIPVRLEGVPEMTALDLHLRHGADISLDAPVAPAVNSGAMALAWNQADDHRWLLGSYARQASGLPTDRSVLHLVVETELTELNAVQFPDPAALINGLSAEVIVKGRTSCSKARAQHFSPAEVLRVGPNPVGEGFEIHYEGFSDRIHRLELIDPLGKKLAEVPVNEAGWNTVETTNWAPGVYFLRVNGQYVVRLLR